ncbi:hypothetical protein B0H21DRAFT_709376 [Amylocystis lapponica]|nr:hypothetical protein B0H21DRAFT_828965 [Amylocystis lapponica]KAH9945566.1 hypothetical protein B0H21DRAFT_709376 [Amylocystis lapponica]
MSLNRQALLLAYFEALFPLALCRRMYEYDVAASTNPMWAADVISSWENLELLVPEMERQGLPLLHHEYYAYVWVVAYVRKDDPDVRAALDGEVQPDDDDDDDEAAVGMEHREDVDFLIMNGAIVGTQRLFRIILNAVQVIWS